MTHTTTDVVEARAEELRALIAKATQEDLADDGRYFAETYDDLTRCRHQETGEYEHSPDGKLVEWLWNKRHVIADLFATAEAASGAAVTAATATDDQLRRIQLLADVELHLKSCRIFLTSREKMHPCGVDLHDELLAKVSAAIEQEGRNG